MQNATRARSKAGGRDNNDSLDRKQLLAALRALRRGDFGARLPDGLSGSDGDIAEAFNDIATQLGSLEAELHEVGHAVGKEGRLGRRLRRPNARNQWGRLAGAFNEAFDEVTGLSAEIVEVVDAVRRGDFSQRVEVDGRAAPLQGISLRHALSVNRLSAELEAYAEQLTEFSRSVGVEGKLSTAPFLGKYTGAWLELGRASYGTISALSMQLREIARVTTAVAQGDLTQTVDIEVRGETLELKHTINTMVGQLRLLAGEVTRVAREVGSQGVLGGQAKVHGLDGIWRELTESVNSMADNLTSQVRNISEVASAIARGDLSKKITINAQGEIKQLATTINTMVEQLNELSQELSRVAREVGTEGKLGGQADVADVSGVWRELTTNVNGMADNLTSQVRNISEVVEAISKGDLSQKIAVDAQGEVLDLKQTINATVDKLRRFAAEVTRVAQLVGTEGTLGVQAEVEDVSGIWKDLTDSVNDMGRNLTAQVRDIAAVTTAVANGELTRKITVDVRGEFLLLKNTVNGMVDSLSSFSGEVTRIAREVGTEGTLGGQASVRDVSGVWKELTNNVNSMASNITSQVRNISEVAEAVAAGDLTRKITVDARGEIRDLKLTINAMVEQLSAFSAQVSRVAREVGVEGQLGGQAVVEGVRGTWRELTDHVNLMANNLTSQVRDIAEVTKAVARGDLTRKVAVDARGEILELKTTVNTMVEQLGSFAEQVTRLAHNVGVQGKLGGQADVRGLAGTWRELTGAVNSMAQNLTSQVRNISEVATAIAMGDLTRTIDVEAEGEILQLKNTINTMVEQLGAFAVEVTRVAREVGTEGQLGGQASVEGVRGTWKELTDNVNLMALNLTGQVRDIAEVVSAISRGELGKKVSVQSRGEIADLKETINTTVDRLGLFTDEVTRVAREVGVEGKLGGQARNVGSSGIWKELTDNVNLMAQNLTSQVRDIAEVTTAVANGDLSRKITVDVRGELLTLKTTVNTMVDQLSSFADEVTRLAREVGTHGQLGGQANVRGVSGTWRELTDNVNLMARNLTAQVRGIARVVTAVAAGDLSQTLRLDASGEIAALVDTINTMTRTLSVFAEQVTGVASEVGIDGRLGGQAEVPGAAGMWLKLVQNVNELAGNLTRQVRAMGEVATAVAKGDLSRTVDVEAHGEVALLKDNVNHMIRTLSETTRINQEQDWLKSNLNRFTLMLQGQREAVRLTQGVLSELCSLVGAQHGAFYLAAENAQDASVRLVATYAFSERKSGENRVKPGEGLVGQAALECKRILVSPAPPDYVKISSGLGSATPLAIAVIPVLFEGQVKGVIELASLTPFNAVQLSFIEQLVESLGVILATIEATSRTDDLLRQSQQLTEELQQQQEELQQTNEELEEKAHQLTEQKAEVEKKNGEVELARQKLEEKARQLSVTSRYKSEFLANMSHELRTPLNSLLILSRQLYDNAGENLTTQQVKYAETIYQSGSDLLSLINEILDLAKIESGTMSVDTSEVMLTSLVEHVERTFGHLAGEKGLKLDVVAEAGVPATIETDDMRLRQILRNLLSNAIKFTEAGTVELRICKAQDAPEDPNATPEQDLAFVVRDTGIGIPADRLDVIFEAFQQADGSTSRRYGGTGLGLSISRELVHLLGGSLGVFSKPGEGSTFVVRMPSARSAGEPAERLAMPLLASVAPSSRTTVAPPSVDADVPDPSEVTEPRVGKRSSNAPALKDDRAAVVPGDRVLLIVEDDLVFAQVLLDMARERGFRGLVCGRGQDVLELATQHRPDAITLDLRLPDIDGWVLLDQLKHRPETRHVPVHVISALDGERRALESGAFSVLTKPATPDAIRGALNQLAGFLEKREKHLMLVEDDPIQRENILNLIGNGDVVTTAVASGEEALDLARSRSFDCLVIDLSLPGISGIELIGKLKELEKTRRTPVIVYTARELTRDEDAALSRITESVIVKDVRSPERLLEETALFLHRVEANLPEDKRDILRRVAQTDPLLEGKRILLVDDDLRNVFALTAVLEQHKIEVFSAENGREALERLAEQEVDAVLMDIMMPEMDGYEAIRRIRGQERFSQLPVIALTAKAMANDREVCIEVGASDYITKPVDVSQLLSLLRVWLYGRGVA